MDKKQPVLRMIEAWAKLDLDQMTDQLADDIRFENVPMDPIVGKAAVRAANGAFMQLMSGADWAVKNITVAENGTVMTERDDIFFLKDGRRVVCPAMGIFEVDHAGKITLWRDYFDLASWNREMGWDPDLGRKAVAAEPVAG